VRNGEAPPLGTSVHNRQHAGYEMRGMSARRHRGIVAGNPVKRAHGAPVACLKQPPAKCAGGLFETVLRLKVASGHIPIIPFLGRYLVSVCGESRCTHNTRFMEDTSTNIRAANFADAKEITRVHLTACRESYDGIVPKGILDALSIAERSKAWPLRQPADGRSEVAFSVETYELFRYFGQWLSFGCRFINHAVARGLDNDNSFGYPPKSIASAKSTGSGRSFAAHYYFSQLNRYKRRRHIGHAATGKSFFSTHRSARSKDD
jgi:hypothetical protein